jgi:hypothetical protein
VVTHSRLEHLVLASDYRVGDPRHAWSELVKRESHLAGIGAHHVAMYESIQGDGRIFVTIGLRHDIPRETLMRSPVVFEWFDSGGVDDIPAVFAGEITEKLDLTDTSVPLEAAGVVFGVIALVEDVALLVQRIKGSLDRFKTEGVQKVWLYRAFDDNHEVMVMCQIDDVTSANRWLQQVDPGREWLRSAGFGAYPPYFLGTLLGIKRIRAED